MHPADLRLRQIRVLLAHTKCGPKRHATNPSDARMGSPQRPSSTGTERHTPAQRRQQTTIALCSTPCTISAQTMLRPTNAAFLSSPLLQTHHMTVTVCMQARQKEASEPTTVGHVRKHPLLTHADKSTLHPARWAPTHSFPERLFTPMPYHSPPRVFSRTTTALTAHKQE